MGNALPAGAAPQLDHDTPAAIDFLKKWSPDADWCLSASIPDGNMETVTFSPSEQEKAAAWIEQRQGRKNLYFQVGLTRTRVRKKTEKEDIAAFRAFYVDVDPAAGEDFEEERQRILEKLTRKLPENVPPPSVIIDSGNGYQAFWLLEEPLPIPPPSDSEPEPWADGEAINRGLEYKFRADRCHNVDRIMRLPGTINIPTKTKLKKGRKRALASLVERNDTRYPVTAFEKLKAPATVTTGKPSTASRKVSLPTTLGDVAPMGTDALRAWGEANGKTIKPRTLALIATGDDPAEPGEKYPSRSEALFAVCCDLVRAGVDDEIIYRVITDPDNEISGHILDQKNWQNYAVEQIEKAHRKVVENPTWDPVNKDGEPQKSYWNTRIALLLMGVECRYDIFRDKHLVGAHELAEMAGEFSDQAQRLLRDEIIRRFGFDPGKDNTNEAVLSLCTENRFDSLIDHLHSLPPWDGQPRLDSWLVDYLDADDNAYTRAAGAAWLTAAVVRAFDPGAKFDHMLVLRGAQGVGKSTALRILAGGADLFSDAAFLHAKDAREILEVTAGVWILECAELDGMRKKDIETLKAAISRQADKGRPAYARSAVTVPRRFVLAGTTNEERFLHDPTGNRRFWPVAVGNVDMERLQADRDQIIAEALHRYRSGNYSLVLEGDAAEGAAAAQQQGRYVDDGYRELLEGFEECGQKWNGHWIVRSDAVYDQLGIPKERRSGNVPQKVSAVMKDLGWVRHDKTVRLDGEPCRIYIWQGEPPEKPF